MPVYYLYRFPTDQDDENILTVRQWEMTINSCNFVTSYWTQSQCPRSSSKTKFWMNLATVYKKYVFGWCALHFESQRENTFKLVTILIN